MNIFLIGYMGSGKSTIGKQLAKVLGFGFIDLDRYIEQQEGLTVETIFAEKGELYFRKAESKHLKAVLDLNNSVVALGGGTPCYGNNMALIKACENAKSIYLKASIKTLAARLAEAQSTRPLIAHLKTRAELEEFIAKHLFERANYYSLSDVAIAVDDLEIEQIMERLVLKLF
ncbi:shikimate kinase [Mangrovimonas yunxiaonensis]|uniref:Shikimate kinase n=1 Tax=Mangrovimonas yunxiaonensis TaxID=1197477 RepID=A0A084TNB9_9FLAO|nr:shikimate kinase [Mangrovimonas yunxiaonensis]KFB02205.1 shikimate kinase [Mangrovimonas yunxiaonensis]